MNDSRALFIAFSAVLSASAAAQTASTATDEVIVTAKGLEEQLPQQLAEYGTRVETASREQVRNGAYADVAQSLQALLPGLYVQPKNGPFDYAYMSLLGSRTQDLLWLVDGVRINNRLYGTTPPLDTLPSSIVQRLEVLEGGQALFYGTDAVAGAINIVTQPFTEKPAGSLSLAGDTNNGRHIDGYLSDALGAHHFVVYGNQDKTHGGLRAFRDEDYQPSATDRHRSYDVGTWGAKYGYFFSDNTRLTASFQQTDADLDFAYPYRVSHYDNSRTERLATVKFDYAASERFGLYLKGYYHTWRTLVDTVYNDLQSPGNQLVLADDAFWGFDDRGINALARLSFTKGFDYFVGYDLQRYGGRDELLFIEPNKEQTQAVFAQVRTTPDLLPNARFAAGLRYNSPDSGAAATVWSLTGQYDISSTLFVRAALGTNFRLPSAEELFANDPGYERGNPNLKPERSKSVNVSLGGTVDAAGRFGWELIGFAREITDLIGSDAFDEATGQSVFNNEPGEVKVRGGEIVLRAAFTDAYSGNLALTRNRSRLDGGAQITRVPEQLLKAYFDYHPANLPIGATLALNYTGHVWNSVSGERVQYGNYAVLDVAGRYFLDSGRRHQLTASVQNVFDKEYGIPSRGCADVADDGPYDCSAPYQYVSLGLPRTLRASYLYNF